MKIKKECTNLEAIKKYRNSIERGEKGEDTSIRYKDDFEM